MPSIFNMFISDANILSEAKKKQDSIKDSEETDDPEMDKNETNKTDNSTDKTDDNTPDDNSEDDDLFADVDHEAEMGDGAGGLGDNNTDTDNNDETSVEGDNSDNINDNQEDDNNTSIDDGSNDNNDLDNNDETPVESEDDNIDNTETQDNSDVLKNKKLIQDFYQLYNDIGEMKDSLSKINQQNELEYSTISKTIDNLNDLLFSINNYITLRFNKTSYNENLAMYYKIVNSVQITDKIISNIIENRNNR